MTHIPYDERAQTYTNALIAYGMKMQLVVAIEELSECQKEICKYLRSEENLDHLIEEIADATIMLEQLRLIFDTHDMVSQRIDEKIRRLDDRLRPKGDSSDGTA